MGFSQSETIKLFYAKRHGTRYSVNLAIRCVHAKSEQSTVMNCIGTPVVEYYNINLYDIVNARRVTPETIVKLMTYNIIF